MVALYLLVAVQATSLARRHLPHRLWRRIHLAAFPLLAVATMHLLTAGSDRINPAVLTMLTATAAATVFLVLFGLLHRPGNNRPGKSGPRATIPPTARGPTGPKAQVNWTTATPQAVGRCPSTRPPRPAPDHSGWGGRRPAE